MPRKRAQTMSDQPESVQQSEDAFDQRILAQNGHVSAPPAWGEVVDIDAKEIAGVRNVTPELEDAARLLAADPTKGIRIKESPETRQQALIIRKLLSKAGYRTRIRSSLFPEVPGSSVLVMFLTLQAILRTSEPATEQGINQ